METFNTQQVQIDIRKTSNVPVPNYYKNDTNVLKVVLLDNGSVADLTNIDRIVANYKTPDKQVISRPVTANANILEYQFGYAEMSKAGKGELTFQFFDVDQKRISTMKIMINILDTNEPNFEFEETQVTLLQQLISEVQILQENALGGEGGSLSELLNAKADKTEIVAVTEALDSTVKTVNGLAPVNGNVSIDVIADTSTLATKTELNTLATTVNTKASSQDVTNLNLRVSEMANTVSGISTSPLNFNGIKYLAHRGAATYAPENTIPAFERAGKIGYWAVECDIFCTSDGHWVVNHDETVDAMTDGTGKVEEMTLAQIKALTIDAGNKVSEFPGTKIPTLNEFLEICIKYKMVPVIEIKAFKNSDQLDSLLSSLRKYNLTEKTIIISFSIAALQGVRASNGKVALGWVATNYNAEVRATLLGLGNSFLDIIDSALTQEIIDDCHANGLKVGVWTVNGYARRDTLVSMGIDIITTDTLI